jgi:hypothetical protein
MNTPKDRGYARGGTPLVNFPFRAEIGRTSAGSPIIHILRRAPADPSHRRLAEAVYDLAARMERRSDELDIRWVISVEAWNARIIVELADDEEAESAHQMLATLMEEFHLA